MEKLKRIIEKFDRANPQRPEDARNQEEFRKKVEGLNLDFNSSSRIEQERINKTLNNIKPPQLSLYEKQRVKKRDGVIRDYLNKSEGRTYSLILTEEELRLFSKVLSEFRRI